MEEPKCRLCGARHSLREPHQFEGDKSKAKAVSRVTPADFEKLDEIMAESEEIQQRNAERRERLGMTTKHCPTCQCPGKRLYSSAAEKQKAYRQRRQRSEA